MEELKLKDIETKIGTLSNPANMPSNPSGKPIEYLSLIHI